MNNMNFYFSLVVFLTFSCAFKGKPQDEILRADQLQGKELFRIDLKKFFQTNDDLFEEQKQNLVPYSIYCDNNYLFIPNKYLKKIEKYSLDGKLLSSIDYSKYNIDIVKFYLDEKDEFIYLLDSYDGIFVLNHQGDVVFRDDKTIDFIVSKNGNIYFQNSVNDKRFYLDRMGILSKPLPTEYVTEFSDNDTLIGIRLAGKTFDSPFIIEKIKLSTAQVVFRSNPDTLCKGCFYLPKFIDANLIVASNVNHLMDQLFVLRNDSKLASYSLTLPVEFTPLMSIDYANYAHTGFSHCYDSENKTLYSLACDNKYLRVFAFDLKPILE